jgi:hypothetical protein
MPNDCATVYDLWRIWGKPTAIDRNDLTACCGNIGSTTQFSGVPGVVCNADGEVIKMDWSSQSLSGSIPPEIGNLVNLQKL